jgi:nucleotide-binding universal stress UspA family protein
MVTETIDEREVIAGGSYAGGRGNDRVGERHRSRQGIANLVSQRDADLLVIGSVARKGIGRLLIGNTAEKVGRQVACSCLVVKHSRTR